MSTEKRRYSLGEEIFNAVSHGVGTLLAVAALAILIIFAALYGNTWHIVTFSIYGTTLVLLYLFSTLYHSFTHQRTKSVFQKLDHSAIYILIAGTYTPFMLSSLRLVSPVRAWTIFGIIWAMAIVGIIFDIFASKKYRWISVVFYLVMGWMIVTSLGPLYTQIHQGGVMWLSIGGACYTVGAIFYILKKMPYSHAIWHLFVLAGSITQFFAILWYVLPLKV